MFAMPPGFLAAVAASFSTWNPSDKGAAVVLSGGDLIASATASVDSVRGSLGHSSGHYYCEMVCSGSDNLVGLGNASAGLSNFPGADANGYGYYNGTGNKYNGSGGVAYGSVWVAGDVIGIEYDNGSLKFYRNGDAQPVAFTGLTGTFFPMWASGTSGAGTRSATLNVGATTFAFGPPAGASAWG